MSRPILRTVYAWDVETVGHVGEVLRHDFDRDLQSLIARHPDLGHDYIDAIGKRLALIRDRWQLHDGGEVLVDRLWAYIHDDELAPQFENRERIQSGYVPRRFLKEYARVNRSHRYRLIKRPVNVVR